MQIFSFKVMLIRDHIILITLVNNMYS